MFGNEDDVGDGGGNAHGEVREVLAEIKAKGTHDGQWRKGELLLENKNVFRSSIEVLEVQLIAARRETEARLFSGCDVVRRPDEVNSSVLGRVMMGCRHTPSPPALSLRPLIIPNSPARILMLHGLAHWLGPWIGQMAWG